eukprot:TRINITY_DN33067_c0_g1_i1.p1 TRINITY_DN33067_c0_g1~~TRINITY_DN33067_c0_g1_i1.p1  ORF type:complete len:125 (+),score=2.84 TRINITY_DN33067_c0_g1_i1:28-402(+)
MARCWLLVVILVLAVADVQGKKKEGKGKGNGKAPPGGDCTSVTSQSECNFYCVWDSTSNSCKDCLEQTTEASCTALPGCEWSAIFGPEDGICHIGFGWNGKSKKTKSTVGDEDKGGKGKGRGKK